jgi:uncharacterized protein (DUF305 family)
MTPYSPKGPARTPHHDQEIEIMGQRILLLMAIIAFAAAQGVIHLIHAEASLSSGGQYPAEAAFLTANAAAMDKMMADMNVRPTGDVDADFATMMIPHHQGAIDMAVVELRHGKNEQLRRISQEIIVDQQQEIVAMRMALGQNPPASAPARTRVPTNASIPSMTMR